MYIEHIAMYTQQLEVLKNYYTLYFGAKANNLYINPKKQFSSYFLTFGTGARIEIMNMPGIPENKNDTRKDQHIGLVHFAFAVSNKQEVDSKAIELKTAGFEILDGPRVTGDGYYEFVTLDPDGNRIEVTTQHL
jgi:lactoylglutathione lyase